MTMQPRRNRTPLDPDELDLLHQLLEETPATPHLRRAPVVLRSAAEQRRHALSGYLFRTWVDTALSRAELLLTLAAIAFFGYWFVDGPVRDWLHAQSEAGTLPAAAAPAPPPPIEQGAPSDAATLQMAPLPFTTIAMEGPAEADFIAPGAGPILRPTPAPLQPTRLAIPAIGLDTPVKEVFVVDGVWEVADYAAGYMHGSALPGEPGTMALAGHAGLRGAVFRDLPALRYDDDILIEAGGWRYRYRVRESKSVWPTETEVLAPSPTPTLVLITCTNWDTQRLIVVADLVESKPMS